MRYLSILLQPVAPLLLALCAMLQREGTPCRQQARLQSKSRIVRPPQPSLTAAAPASVNRGRAYIHKHFCTY